MATYYPLSRITPNLYTSGNQFTVALTGKDYKGYYYSTYDGKYFTGETVSPSALEIIPIDANKKQTLSLGTAKYDSMTNITTKPSPVSYVAVPTPQDYKNGYYQRFFSKRVNGDLSTIQEISQDTFTTLANNVLYNTIQIQWMLTGPLEDKYMSGMLVLGVINRNTKTVTQASRQMQYLDQYLTNPIEYYQK